MMVCLLDSIRHCQDLYKLARQFFFKHFYTKLVLEVDNWEEIASRKRVLSKNKHEKRETYRPWMNTCAYETFCKLLSASKPTEFCKVLLTTLIKSSHDDRDSSWSFSETKIGGSRQRAEGGDTGHVLPTADLWSKREREIERRRRRRRE